jgi:hypothetical protein
MALKDIPEIEAEFAGWEGWQSLVNRQLHARQRGSVPTFMVHAETLDGLRQEVRMNLDRPLTTLAVPGRIADLTPGRGRD